MNKNEIIDRISFFRTRKKISARQLSLDCGLNPAYISRLESKTNFLPSVETLMEIITLGLEITEEEFFYGDLQKYQSDKEILEIFKDSTPEQIQVALSVLKLNKKQ